RGQVQTAAAHRGSVGRARPLRRSAGVSEPQALRLTTVDRGPRMRSSFQPLLLIILLLALIALQVKLWVGEGGMRDVKVIEQGVAVQREENAELRARNEALAAEVEELKHGDEAVEERARSEMGLI